MLASAYLNDLGGLSAHRRVIRLDLRGTGDSDVPADLETCRCDRLVDDIEALREHLGLEQVEVLGHSAGGTLTVLYAARYPERVSRMVLLAPSPRAVGIDVTDADRRAVAELRREEPWFSEGFAAFERIWSGKATEADWDAITPFSYGRWQAEAKANVASEAAARNANAAAVFYSEGALDPAATRSALAGLAAPVLLIAGEYDVGLPPKRAAKYAELFPHAELVVQPGGAHFPWLDDPVWLVQTVADFLR